MLLLLLCFLGGCLFWCVVVLFCVCLCVVVVFVLFVIVCFLGGIV